MAQVHIATAAKLFNVSKRCLRCWADSGYIAPAQKKNKRVYVDTQSIRDYLNIPDGYITVKQVIAKKYDITDRTLRLWCHDKKLTSFMRFGQWWILESALREALTPEGMIPLREASKTYHMVEDYLKDLRLRGVIDGAVRRNRVYIDPKSVERYLNRPRRRNVDCNTNKVAAWLAQNRDYVKGLPDLQSGRDAATTALGFTVTKTVYYQANKQIDLKYRSDVIQKCYEWCRDRARSIDFIPLSPAAAHKLSGIDCSYSSFRRGFARWHKEWSEDIPDK